MLQCIKKPSKNITKQRSVIILKISDINPHIRYARIHYAHTYTSKYSICYDCRLFFMENAVGYVLANDVKHNFSNGDIVYLPPRTKYRFYFKSNENLKIIILNFDLINNFSDIETSLGTANEQNFNPDISPHYEINELLREPIVKQMPQMKASLTQCTDNFLKKVGFYRERSSALLKLCLLELIRHNISDTPYSLLCEKVLTYIHENYADTTLTNEDISRVFNYHPYHLSRIIKQETGKTLHNYLMYYRLRIAKNLLVTTQYDIEDIAWRAGFSSSTYFIKLFRLNTGLTPKKYRKLQFNSEF